jgi:hypothetical protein
LWNNLQQPLLQQQVMNMAVQSSASDILQPRAALTVGDVPRWVLSQSNIICCVILKQHNAAHLGQELGLAVVRSVATDGARYICGGLLKPNLCDM